MRRQRRSIWAREHIRISRHVTVHVYLDRQTMWQKHIRHLRENHCEPFTAPLYEDRLSRRRDLEQQLVGQLGRTVQQTFTHLEGPVLVHGVTQQNVCTRLALLHHSSFHPHLHSIVHCWVESDKLGSGGMLTWTQQRGAVTALRSTRGRLQTPLSAVSLATFVILNIFLCFNGCQRTQTKCQGDDETKSKKQKSFDCAILYMPNNET